MGTPTVHKGRSLDPVQNRENQRHNAGNKRKEEIEDEQDNRYIAASKMFSKGTNTPPADERYDRMAKEVEDEEDADSIPLKKGLRYEREQTPEEKKKNYTGTGRKIYKAPKSSELSNDKKGSKKIKKISEIFNPYN